MEVIAHRGYWETPHERNSLTALERAFAGGFGAEIDVRDLDGELVVSHDLPRHGGLRLHDVLVAYRSVGMPGTLAVNIKSDGLSDRLSAALQGTPHWFAFDMSVPDMLHYARAGLPFYTRRSEIETHPPLLGRSDGVWLDSFYGDWFGEDDVAGHLEAGRSVCVVSPELHGREAGPVWRRWARWRIVRHPGLSLCTDHPMRAREILG